MTYNIQDIELVVRETQRQMRKRARQNLMDAIISGKQINIDEVMKARGLVLRERENSIFSDAWIPLALLFVLIGLFAANVAAFFILGTLLLLTVGVSKIWKNLALIGVTYERHFDRTKVFPNEPITMSVVINNYKPLPLTWLQLRDELPISVDEDATISRMASEIAGHYTLYNTLSMHGYERIERTFTLRIPKRGFYHLGPVSYESGDIFTLYTIERQHQYLDTLIVYPQIWPLSALALPAKEPFGEMHTTRSLFTDPIKTQGIRDYQPQDRFRDVHWKATARRGRLQTKVYDPSTGMTLALFLNVATSEKYWMGFEPAQLERAISVAASIANYGVEAGWAVGLYANGAVPNSDQPIRVAPGRSPAQLGHLLEALAAVTEFATGSIEWLIWRQSANVPWAATLVLITAVVTEEMAATLLHLQEAGRRIVLISLAAEPPPKMIGTILTYHIPGNAPAFQQAGNKHAETAAALHTVPHNGTKPDPQDREA